MECVLLALLLLAPAEGASVVLGVDRLERDGFAPLRGKRVGLICNQTSVDSRGVPTRLILQRALGRDLVALFAPEHGIDGRAPAGRYISTTRDRITGLPVFSLYAATRKPAPWMLRDIDVLVYDLQDIGARSYTYISTMALAMEACGQNGKQFVVLDRPNPLGGQRVQGPPLERRWKSFVGQVPVPYLHGLTTGELAQMINAEGWNERRCRLTVVPMLGWQRWMTWTDTGLRWVPTSPNIPKNISPLFYATTGILGGFDGVDIGIGTSGPFEVAGGRGIDPNFFTEKLRRLNTPGVAFYPYRSSRKAGFAGSRIVIDPHTPTDLLALAVGLVYEVNKDSRGAPLRQTRGDTLTLFHKVYGSDSLYHQLRAGRSPGTIIAGWQRPNQSFRSRRQRYLLYK
ncbi:MAG: exo-beta-N-acetylmuramidase NamZ family protein [Verrucomicrobiales bacterium]